MINDEGRYIFISVCAILVATKDLKFSVLVVYAE